MEAVISRPPQSNFTTLEAHCLITAPCGSLTFMLWLRLEKIVPARPGSSGLVFATRIGNNDNRLVNIVSFDFELWVRHERPSDANFRGKLWPDSVGDFSDWTKLESRQDKPLLLSWHYVPKDLQEIEDWRNGGNLHLEIRSQIGATSVWPQMQPSFLWERIYSKEGSAPIQVSYPQSDWVALMNQIGFRNIMLYELPAPPFPPGFARSQELLASAWNNHREGRPEEAMQNCFKAFECLGFNLAGQDTKREEILAHLLADAHKAKREKVEELWNSLSEFLHLGRHERGETVALSMADSEMALVCATSLLRYLATQPR